MHTCSSRFALAALPLLAILLAGCTASEMRSGSSSEAMTSSAIPTHAAKPSGWREADDFPLAPRDTAVESWTGEELLVIGGISGPPCPATADCEVEGYERDGAALDPSTGAWRRISDAPLHPVGGAAVVDGAVYVLGREELVEGELSLISYDIDGDEWRTTDVPADFGRPSPVVLDGAILFFSPTDELGETPDFAFDPQTETWTELLDDPFGASFDRQLIPTPHGVVLFARAIADLDGEGPLVARAALLEEGGWRILTPSEQVHGEWTWTGERLVAPDLGWADGGETDPWDEPLPYGGTYELLDGGWAPFEDPPEPVADAWTPDELGTRFSTSAGYLYDDRDASWTSIDAPDSAPDTAGDAAWAGDELVVLGGVSWADALEGTRSPAVWIHAPAGD